MTKGNDNPPVLPTLGITGFADIDDGTEKLNVHKFVLRLPPELRDRIAEAANTYRRSMNSEIIARVELTFSGLPSEATMVMIEPPLQGPLDALFRRSLSEEEHALVRSFRRLTAAKRKALNDLLK